MELDPLVLPVSAMPDSPEYKQMIDDYVEELKATVEIAAQIPDEMFPNFIYEAMINDFGDNYYERGINYSDLQVPNIRKKYANFFDYVDALELYEEYMAKLLDKYGTKKILKSGAKLGLIPETILDKPRLKRTKKNRQIMKSEILPSRRAWDYVPADELHRVIETYLPTEKIHTEEGFADPTDEKPPKEIRKIFREASRKQAESARKRNIYSSRRKNADFDMIVEFMNAQTASHYDAKGQEKDVGSLSATIEIWDKYEGLTDEELERILNPKKSYIKNGQLVDQYEDEKIELYKILYENGYDLLGSASKSMSKAANRMLRNRVAGLRTGPLSKKELKKIKKRAKSEKKRMEKEREGEEVIYKTLMANKIDFDRKDPASFRLSDIFDDDD